MFLLSIRMSEQTLKFDNVRVNEKEFHKSKQPIDLDLVNADQIVVKVKVRNFNGVIKTNFLGDEIPKESVHYTCIACITIDSVMKMKKMNYLQVYLEECKYKIKKIKMPKLINTELESESELEFGTELETKSELESDSE